MPNNELGKPRRSQVIHNYGPGAIVDFGAGANTGAAISVCVAGLEEWDRNAPPQGLLHPQVISEPRLQKQLKVRGFRLPPVTPDNSDDSRNSLTGVRFPEWLQCPVCNRLKRARHWDRKDVGNPARYCGECSAKERRDVHVGPVRFIVACPDGHLDEFPWDLWVGHKEGCTSRGYDSPSQLVIRKQEKAGLAGLLLVCMNCGEAKSLEGIFGSNVLTSLGYRCRGKRPWLGTKDESCDAEARVLQRGASNVYFPATLSALDIPPWSDSIMQRLGVYWKDLVDCSPEDRADFVRLNKLDEKVRVPAEKILEQVDRGINALEASGASRLRAEEYEQFLNRESSGTDTGEFETRLHEPPPELARYFGPVVQATRLREVRALYAFTRITPPPESDPGQPVRYAPIRRGPLDWLPAIEVRGEGIFLSLNDGALRSWETNASVQERASQLHKAWLENWQKRHGEDATPSREITPRFVLLHSLSHALMRQLALDCGYASASLRERLYVDTGPAPMAGLLIYTATPDSEGTLGGLVRQGAPGRLAALVPAAIRAMKWCSNDPLCIKDIATLSEATNRAACHACLMSSETSCEEFNSLLDRAMLIGLPDDPAVGFFSGMLNAEVEL